MADEQFKVSWVDGHREPTVEPNPEFPNGIDLMAGDETKPRCRVELSYPAERCGYWKVECRICGQRVMVTTAGRPDDPRSATFNCHVPPPKPEPKKPKKKPKGPLNG